VSAAPSAGKLDRDKERVARICAVLAEAPLDALVCAMPSNVLLQSGYWPVIGNAVAIVTREGVVGVVAPEDELDYARHSWADFIWTFGPASLDRIESPLDAIREPLRDATARLGLTAGARVGFEASGSFDPSSYASSFEYGAGMRDLLVSALGDPALADATELLARLRSRLTAREIGIVRTACGIAQNAFKRAVPRITPGTAEVDIAGALRGPLITGDRCDGFAYCMSGPNSARAYAAYQRSTSRELKECEFILLHCNSSCGGFWTDITRTFVIGPPSSRQSEIYEAVRDATEAAFNAVRPGARAAAIDEAARTVLSSRGFSKEFKHGTGHGVGFAAINHNARPRIHPASTETLETGMVFNIEPAVYLEREGGMRQCNMALVTGTGVEWLTPFLNQISELIKEA
jgi:Xaa-Pro aminopeptidase